MSAIAAAAPPTGSPSTRRYVSVLFVHEPDREGADPPDYFTDLNLDQLLDSVLTGRGEYDLADIYRRRLLHPEEVAYRQAVLHDLEEPALAGAVSRFAERMRTMRGQVERSAALRYPFQRQMWWLAAADSYRAAVAGLADDLNSVRPGSPALQALREELTAYQAHRAFTELESDAKAVAEALGRVRYRLQIYGGRVQVSRAADNEDNYAADVATTFERFRQSATASYRTKLTRYPEMNHVEEAIADRVAWLFPGPFGELAQFCTRHAQFIDDTVARFDREVQFYLAWLEFTERLTAAGLPIGYPTIADPSDRLDIADGYDVALADRLTRDRRHLVGNDLRLAATERTIVVTGPNQGGKTTYARMIGQLHHLAALGLTVPAKHATLPLPDLIGTHFERGENLHDLTGKLDDDLVRIHRLLQSSTDRSLLILNESFTSTTADDALWLSTQVLDRIRTLGCRCVCVTFLDELAGRGSDTTSMVAEVDPADPGRRTLRLIRRPADGRAYAAAVAARYGLTSTDLQRRLGS